MARKKSNVNAGSLDLLLDTICNTFGGILLIALLVVIMLTETTKSTSETPEQSAVELVKNENIRQELTQKLESLILANAQFNENFEVEIGQIRGILNELRRTELSEQTKAVKCSKLIGEQNELQQSMNSIEAENSKRKDNIVRTKKDRDHLITKLGKAMDDAATEVTIRSVKANNKEQRAYILKDGTLYGPIFINGLKRNTSEFNFVEKEGTVHIEPKEDAGEVVPDEFSSTDALERKFTGFSSQTFDIRIFVYPDSYGRYSQVEKAIRKRNLKVQLILSTADESIVFTSDDGGKVSG